MSQQVKRRWELGYQPEPRPRLYNILLVVVDDLRADHLPAWGYHRETTRFLDRRLQDATLFRNCHSPVGWTLPACATIITGQSPDGHGLSDHNCRFRKPKLGHYLGDDYFRIGITNNGNVVTDSISRKYLESLGFKRRPAKWRFFGWDDGFDEYLWTHREDHFRPFTLACDLLDDRAGSGGDKPYFLFFHTNIVHDYHMDRPYYLDVEDWIGEEIHPELRGVRDGPDIWRHPPKGLSRKMLRRQFVAKYDAGIRFTDQKIEEIFSRVNFDDTIVVFVSDHGEGFDVEYGRVHHCGRLNSDLTHVPLAVWLPPELKAKHGPPAVERRHVSTEDIVPTLLTLLGDAVGGFPGQFLYDPATHTVLSGCDRGYIFWEEDCVRESYDTCRIEIRSTLTYPLRTITARKNDAVKEFAYNLGYDPREVHNLIRVPAERIPGFEPISFVVAAHDQRELDHNVLSSPVARSPHHEWLIVDNSGNARFASISKLYSDVLDRAANDLVLFVHEDVYLPYGWEERFFRSLSALEAKDPEWGVIGSVGALPYEEGKDKELRGHWCDPSGYYLLKPLPHEVDSLDEQWLGVRKSHEVRFDPQLPGFHCYGMDLSLSARDAGRKSYAIDCFVWHKYRDAQGRLVGRREQSEKIQRRWSEEFMSGFQPSVDYVEKKWKQYLPFQTTSWTWAAG